MGGKERRFPSKTTEPMNRFKFVVRISEIFLDIGLGVILMPPRCVIVLWARGPISKVVLAQKGCARYCQTTQGRLLAQKGRRVVVGLYTIH
jgi:hypothetical protein